MLEQAALKGWRAAALEHFSGDPHAQTLVTDWQCAAWLPLLALDRRSVVLDLAGGYGAVSHSLARTAGQVFSLESSPQRAEFIRLRLRQEGLSNVQLVQANSFDTPFADGTFDLIVGNGVLVSMGESARRQDPREVHLRLLKRLCRMLKPDGCLLLGVDNRYSYAALRETWEGRRQSNGNLPRQAAESGSTTRDSAPNSSRDRWKFTYPAAGYRRLLAASGFRSSVFYWPDPHYDQPYALVPLEDALIADRVDSLLSEPTVPLFYQTRHLAKRALARSGVLRHMVSSFVILAATSENPSTALWRQLRTRFPSLPEIRAPRFTFSSGSFGRKGVMRAFEDRAREPICVVKTGTPAPGQRSSLYREYDYLQYVNERLAARPNACFTAPHPYGIAEIGSLVYLAESVAPGVPLSRAVFPAKGHRRFKILSQALAACVPACAQIGQALALEQRCDRVDPSWLNPPAAIRADSGAMARFEGLLADCAAESVQHGDLTLENVFLDSSGRLTIIDWEHMFQGGSVLHDLFTLCVSLALGDDSVPGYTDAASCARFENLFFGTNLWTDPVRQALLGVCRALAVPEAQVLPMLVHFLVLRFNQLKSRNSPLAEQHAAFLAAALRRPDNFLIPAGN